MIRIVFVILSSMIAQCGLSPSPGFRHRCENGTIRACQAVGPYRNIKSGAKCRQAAGHLPGWGEDLFRLRHSCRTAIHFCAVFAISAKHVGANPGSKNDFPFFRYPDIRFAKSAFLSFFVTQPKSNKK
ncbi:hypothetical protein [Klebsiella quasipneumoniae]|uniref:hypothetical protein n=1 Tax=Klebsiella quasipneumoniae TaxID=1463165 RepID=UPI00388EC9F3